MSYNKVSNQQALDVKRIDRYEDKTSNTTASSSSSSKRKGKIESYSTKSSKQRKTSSRTNESCDKIMNSIMDDPRSPHQVQKNVQCVIESWGRVAPVCPEHFLNQLLSSRGYCHDYINALDHRINP